MFELFRHVSRYTLVTGGKRQQKISKGKISNETPIVRPIDQACKKSAPDILNVKKK